MIALTSNTKLDSLTQIAKNVMNIEGDAAECGVYQGGSLRAIAQALPHKKVYGFDTFNGLPKEAWSAVEVHKTGEFSDTALSIAIRNTADLTNVSLIPGLFPESVGEQSTMSLMNSKFSFVYLDFDYYRSTKWAIEWFRPRMSHGAAMVFDDYGWPDCPGVKQAINDTGLRVCKLVDYQVVAYF